MTVLLKERNKELEENVWKNERVLEKNKERKNEVANKEL